MEICSITWSEIDIRLTADDAVLLAAACDVAARELRGQGRGFESFSDPHALVNGMEAMREMFRAACATSVALGSTAPTRDGEPEQTLDTLIDVAVRHLTEHRSAIGDGDVP